MFSILFIFFLSTPDYEKKTYSFENSIIGSYGTKIDFIDEIDSDLNCSAKILSDDTSGNKYLQLNDSNNSGKVSLSNNWYTHRRNVIIEFDVSKNYETGILQIYVVETRVGRVIWMQIKNNDLVIREEASRWKTIKSDFFIVNTSFNIKIILDDLNNQFKIYIDGIEEGTFKFDSESKNGADSLILETTDSNISEYTFNLDNITHNWMPSNKILTVTIVFITDGAFLIVLTIFLIIKKKENTNQNKDK